MCSSSWSRSASGSAPRGSPSRARRAPGSSVCSISLVTRPPIDSSPAPAGLLTRTVGEHPLIGLRQAECITRLVRAPPLDVAQADPAPLRRGKRLDRQLDDASGLGGEEAVFRPRLGPRGPMTGPALVVGRKEAFGPDRRFLHRVRPLERGEGQRPAFALGPRLGDVGRGIRKVQVLSDERASKRSMPFRTPTQVS